MDDADYKALLERQAKEREALEKALAETREERAQKAARAEQDRPAPTLHPPGTLPAKPSLDSLLPKHRHNQQMRDQQQLSALDKEHEAERATARTPASAAFNEQAKKSPWFEDNNPSAPNYEIKR